MDSIKKSKNSNHEGQDLISNLPDFIIVRILSCLPARDAVRTSVLSKRWIFLWTFITNLHFNDGDHYHKKIRKTRFLNFVYRVLLHLNTSCIQSFSLTVKENYDPDHINQWLSTILNRRVKEIFIDSKKKLDISSHSLWKSQSLEKLVLNMDSDIRRNGCAIRVNVSTFVCLSSLTVLKLSGITFSCDPFNDSQKLNLNLPVLRKYEAENCTWLNVKGVTLDVPLLEVLLIKHKVVSISDESHTVIKFCAPRLTAFSYSCYMLPDTILLDIDLSTARITYAKIHTYQFMEESEEKTAFHACEVLKQFNNNVKYLKYERSKIEYGPGSSYKPSRIRVLALVDLPEFGMLSRLELGQTTGEILLDLLPKTPFLKTLILKELLEFDEELSNAANVPSCFVNNLKVVNFGRLNGDEHELRFPKFVMENALVLKRASFVPSRKLRRSNFEEVKEKISSFKRSVSFAYIEFLSH